MHILRFILLAQVLIICSCSTSTPVMSAGGDVYTVSQSGTTGFTPLGPLRAGAYDKANRFAELRGGVAEIISVNETPAGIAVWPKVDVRFRVNRGGGSLTSTGLRPVERITSQSAYDANGRNTDTTTTIER